MHVREATRSDIPRLQQIRAAVRENILRDQSLVQRHDYEDHIDGRGRTWVAEDDGVILGFSAADGQTATIWALFVDPAYEGRGAGRALIAPAVAWLFDRGADVVALGTAPGTRAERFYQMGGWAAHGLDKSGELRLSLARPAV